jgi:tetratricopeptide (TPR) repeat protein
MRNLLWIVCLATGCVATPKDPYVRGERALVGGDLAAALSAFDAVPVAHARYPEARAAAIGIERRLRRSHEELLTALLLRAEWRDREALQQFDRVREFWPAMPGLVELIAATRRRSEILAVPIASEARPAAAPPLAGGADAAGSNAAAPPAPAAAPAGEIAAVADADTVGRRLAELEAMLFLGDLSAALDGLAALANAHPGEPRVRGRLVRVLHQRALLRYGQGSLVAAIDDWQVVLELDPEHEAARSLLRAAQAELALPSARR